MVHRPETDTPLKNKDGSEREINLHGWVADVVDDWMTDRHPRVQDRHGRTPLLATNEGRPARSTIRNHVYKLTACGSIGDGCTCSANCSSQCPDSVAPHDVRRSSISAWLDGGADPALLSGRVDSSESTTEKHYDVRSETEKRELRRDAFDM